MRKKHFILFIFLAVALLVFHESQKVGGETWDERTSRVSLERQLAVASDWLAGDVKADFRRIESEVAFTGESEAAFYGIVPALPAYIAEKIAVANGVSETRRAEIHRYSLHATACIFYILSVILTFQILSRFISSTFLTYGGASLLALYPLWLGFAFFNYKDIPVAGLALMAAYAGVALLQAQERRDFCTFGLLLTLATILIAGCKIAALVLIMPSWAAAVYVFVRHRVYFAVPVFGALATLGIIAITPVGWSDPIRFTIAAVKLMSRHSWNGCTLTASQCMAPQNPEWSAATYMFSWFIVQLPIIIACGAIFFIFWGAHRKNSTLLIVFSVLIPLLLIVARNSTLYNGLRQLLFAMPLIFILAILGFHEAEKRFNRAKIFIRGIILLQAMIFVLDILYMFPYSYVYFNEIARHMIDERVYKTDYWGFSLKEAALKSFLIESPKLIIGIPPHLVKPFVPTDRTTVGRSDIASIRTGTEVLLISYIQEQDVPYWCTHPAYVSRHLAFSRRVLHLSFAAFCKIP